MKSIGRLDEKVRLIRLRFKVSVTSRGTPLPILDKDQIATLDEMVRLSREGLNSGEIAKKITKEIRERLSFLVNVGLDYLNLDRTSGTLSGGESQRIRLASQIGSGLSGVMYVLDEPSIGLHQRDNARLIGTLRRLRDLGNSVLVVEHDEDMIRSADHVVDMGPGAGVHGGEVVAQRRLGERLPVAVRGQGGDLGGIDICHPDAIAVSREGAGHHQAYAIRSSGDEDALHFFCPTARPAPSGSGRAA